MLDALRALEALTRQEPGCVAFSFYQALSDPEAFVLLEHFATQEAFEQHLQQGYTLAFFQRELVIRSQVRLLPSLPMMP